MEQELYELPEGWEWKTLNELSKVQSGTGFPKKYQGNTGEEFPFLKVSDMNLPGNESDITFWNNSINSETGSVIKAKIMPAGTVIFPKIGAAIATNKKRILTISSAFDNNVMGLEARGGLTADFLYWYLQGFDLSEWASSAALPSMKAATIKEHKIPLPPLNEQKRIVARLEALFTRIDTAITHLQETLELTKALFASVLRAEVSGDGHDWPCRSLNSLGDFSGGGTPSKSKSEYWDGDIPWISPKDMKSWELSDSELKITALAVAKSSAKMLPPNSVLIVARSGILRHTLPVCINRVEATVNQDIKVFIPGKDVTPEYMQYLLKGHESYILSQLVKGGVTVESLKYKEFQNHVFPIPGISEQHNVVIHLDVLSERTRTLEAATEEKLNDLTALKASLLDAAFKGQLIPARQVETGK